MRNVKKVLSMTVVIVLVLSVMPIQAFASDDDSSRSAAGTASIYKPGDGVNEGFTLLTEEQIKEEAALAAEAEAYLKAKEADSTRATWNTVFIGDYKQTTGYNCGPAAARNVIQGYYKYVAYSNGTPLVTAPSESTLGGSTYLNTSSSSGTDFNATRWQKTLNDYCSTISYKLAWGTSNWNSDMRTRVIYSIDSGGNRAVVANLYHNSANSSQYVNSAYSGGIAHYISIYGYDDSSGIYYIVDSNTATSTYYQAAYYNAAWSTQARGIVYC